MDKVDEQWIPGKLQYKTGSIVDASEKYIIAHCHCIGEAHDNVVTEEIFKKYKFADIYTNRQLGFYDQIGSIKIMGNGQDQRYVINLLSQEVFESPEWITDEFNHNYKFFVSSMNKAYRIKNLESIAIEEHLGSWNKYLVDNWPSYVKILEKYALKFSKVRTVVYTSKKLL